jgi:hypothetical protein
MNTEPGSKQKMQEKCAGSTMALANKLRESGFKK